MGTEGTAASSTPTQGENASVSSGSSSAPSEGISMASILANQGLVEVSEADLGGPGSVPGDVSANQEPEARTEATPEKTDKKPEDKSDKQVDSQVKPEDKKDEPTPDASKETDGEDPNAEKTDKKVPKGFVPNAALKEERRARQAIQAELGTVRNELAELRKALDSKQAPKPAEPGKFDSFKVISSEEFNALAAEDPAAALVYQKDLFEFREYERAQKEEREAVERDQAYEQTVYRRTNAMMEEIVPGLFDPDSNVQEELVEFANSIGFTDDMFYLTNPATLIVLPGQNEPVLLGEQAADIMRLLVTVKSKLSSVKSEAPDVEALKATLRAELESEILSKVKGETPNTFKSLNSLTKDTVKTPGDAGRVLSEAEFSKLPPAEQELYLSSDQY